MRRGVRSATGCQECRARHVKCDEKKPACLRCNKRKSSCTYGKKLEWCHSTAPSTSTANARRSRARRTDYQAVEEATVVQTNVRDIGHHDLEFLETPHFVSTTTVLDELAQRNDQSVLEFSYLFPTRGLSENAACQWHAHEILTFSANQTQSAPMFAEQFNPGTYVTGVNLDVDRSTALMNFYFVRVAPMFSCYDGGKNPFDHLVKQVWHNQRNSAEYSFLIGAIQGLAAVFLSKDDSSFREEALFIQRQTQTQLEHVAESQRYDPKYLFALVLLGISWMYSQDVPSSFKALKRLRDILQIEAIKDPSGVSKLRDRELRFFWGLQIHCEVFFACTDGIYCLPSIPAQIRYIQDDHSTSIYPHPFTGVANAISTSLLEVIQLVKKQRQLARSHAFASRKHLDALQNLMAEAEDLEQHTFMQSVPKVQQIEDPGDPSTPVEHLVKMAECHRETALLQLYRVFPDLLVRRLGLEQVDPGHESVQNVDELVEKHCYAMAIHILDSLSLIPDSSSTTPFQTILLLTTSSELRLTPEQEITDSSMSTTIPETKSSENIKIMETRSFVVKRLSSSQHPIPGDRLPKLLGIVRNIWFLLDCGEKSETAYWFDVVMQ